MKGNPLTSDELKEKLNEFLLEPFQNWGLNKYNGTYLWFSDFSEFGVRKVFSYQKLKGESGTFRWGFCYEFIPTLSNTMTIKNHKTEKSVQLHLFDEPLKFITFRGTPFTDYQEKGMVSEWGISEFNRTFNNLWNESKASIKEWFDNYESFDWMLKTIEHQLEFGSGYRMRSTRQDYIKAFLLMKIGRMQEGVEILERVKSKYIEFDKKWEIPFEKIMNKLGV